MSSETKVLIPDLGEFSGVEVVEVLVAPGDLVEVETPLITLESDKATMEIPSPHAGVVREVPVKVGDSVDEGDLLLLMEVDEDERQSSPEPKLPTSERPPEPAAEETEAVQAPAPSPDPEAAPPPGEKQKTAPPVIARPSDAPAPKAHASPSVRRFARELGVDLTQVRGSGPKDRITRDDVQNFIKKALSGGGAAPVARGPLQLPAVPDIDFSVFGEVEEQPLGRIRQLSGAHLSACWLNIPHVTQFDQADITELEAFRQQQKKAASAQQISMTLMPFLIKASVAVLREMPDFNSSLSADGLNLIRKKYFHIGIAVDTPNGLVVPVIRDVDSKGILELAAELMEVSAKAREGKLLPADMRGGCFSISSLGGIGGTAFTPIVNAPEVAILGVSRATTQPVWDGVAFAPRLMLPLSLSYDHRVIDGAQAVRFTRLLTEMLSDIRRLLL